MIWGIIGMVLAIPIFAIICVVSRNVPAFYAFGYLFSSDEEKK
jgi:predicted PurR-regulated permease PerM